MWPPGCGASSDSSRGLALPGDHFDPGERDVAFGIGDECGRLGIGKGPRYCMTPKQRSRCATPAALAWGPPAGRVPGEEEVTNHDGTAACSFDILAD